VSTRVCRARGGVAAPFVRLRTWVWLGTLRSWLSRRGGNSVQGGDGALIRMSVPVGALQGLGSVRTVREEGVEMAGSTRDVARSILPIPDQGYSGTVLCDAKDPDAKFAPIRPWRPREGAPDVLIVLLDDVGFGASSAFGGPCETPTFERVAAQGLRYTRFHTTGLCSPSRAALLSGRSHHMVGLGGITEMATSARGITRSGRTVARRWRRS
jgi:Sulfatase